PRPCHIVRADAAERREEHDQQQQFDRQEIPVHAPQLARRSAVDAPPGRQQAERRRGHAEPRRQEQPAERPGVAPQWLIADAEQHARVTGEPQSQERADAVEGPAEPGAAQEPPPGKLTAENSPKNSSSQTPTDIGDAGLKLADGPVGSASMCQKRIGCPRSSVNSTGQITIARKLSENAILATGSSRGSRSRRRTVPSA